MWRVKLDEVRRKGERRTLNKAWHMVCHTAPCSKMSTCLFRTLRASMSKPERSSSLSSILVKKRM